MYAQKKKAPFLPSISNGALNCLLQVHTCFPSAHSCIHVLYLHMVIIPVICFAVFSIVVACRLLRCGPKLGNTQGKEINTYMYLRTLIGRKLYIYARYSSKQGPRVNIDDVPRSQSKLYITCIPTGWDWMRCSPRRKSSLPNRYLWQL